MNRTDDAILVAETCQKLDPYNGGVKELIRNLREAKRAADILEMAGLSLGVAALSFLMGILVRDLLTCQFSLNLQSREEPGALAIVDALRAGCVLIGSPVGCYPEMVRDRRDGFLIPGHADEVKTQERAAARAHAMYAPELKANSDEIKLRIED
jgi:glycosyltransferase involved in cell wall biosynthesis